MRYTTVFSLSLMMLVNFASIAGAEDGFESIFNGKDLSGWKGDQTLWSVVDGAITGTTNGPDHLAYNKFLIWDGTAADFELRMKFRLEGKNNSGVQYRSLHDKKRGDWVVVGYQADIHSNPPFTGMLYDEKGRGIIAKRGQKVIIEKNGQKKAKDLPGKVEGLDLTKWHELTIIAKGNRLVHKVDGKVTVDVTDHNEKERELDGVIALQVHRGPAMKAQFKDIRIKKFAPEKPVVEPTATAVESLIVAKGFNVELLYTVPKGEMGSWVNMCTDPKGRLIVSDQYGGLYRVTPPAIGSNKEIGIEKIDVNIGEAQGLLWAFDSLYVVVNRGGKFASGVYRVRDTNGDDKLDSLETLRLLDGSSEHGPHAILLAPDGKSLYVVCGNKTKLTEFATSRVPRVWDEDNLLPRAYGRGFMKGTPAPGGYISKMDPDGKNWELIAAGFRNEFDAALNADGELFTYDADMEWDMNTPWYRPTRVNHVVSGGEYGWRNGGGKWPAYYPDSVGAVVNIGPGSPTGVCSGAGAKFPAKYQNALFINDWSYGKMYAVHLVPKGASYTGVAEEFITGTPLPLTDVIINPRDGAMYFAIGGRRVQSGLYRVTYQGDTPTEPFFTRSKLASSRRNLRRHLESMHAPENAEAVDAAWPHLNSDDRYIRYAARIAIEHQDVETWQDRALNETDTKRSLAALLALTRQFQRAKRGEGGDIDTPPPVFPAADDLRHAIHPQVMSALAQHDWSKLTVDEKVELLRVYTLAFLRLGPPNEETRAALIKQFADELPSNVLRIDYELSQMLVYLQAPQAAKQVVALLVNSPAQEEQIAYAKTLRHLREGWTPKLQKQYFEWFVKASGYRGGASFGLFVTNIKNDAVANLNEADRAELKELIDAKPSEEIVDQTKTRPVVKDWKLDELTKLVESGLSKRNFDNGKKMFGIANCFRCHRFDQQGGAIGPDLTILSGRFSPRDILESIVQPSKTVSDQYAAVQIITLDGKVVNGRIVNLKGDNFRINTNMLDPNALTIVDRTQIDEMTKSKTSMMPEGLLNTLSKDEILDLMAYLLSRGDPNHKMFE